jgi:hypothetical protein
MLLLKLNTVLNDPVSLSLGRSILHTSTDTSTVNPKSAADDGGDDEDDDDACTSSWPE